MTTTTYTVFINNNDVDSRSKKSKAIELAEQALATQPDANVEVRTAAGTVVWPEVTDVTEQVAEVVTTSGHSKPWTRTETPNFEAPAISGYTAAYTRARVGAVVYRKDGVKGDYLVVTVKAGKVTEKVAVTNTVEAREVTNELAAKHRAALDAAKVKADAEKEAAKVAKAEAKVKADAEKVEAKRLADEAKAKAKAEKDAAAAAAAEAKELAEVTA
jgi:hypothetical protein